MVLALLLFRRFCALHPQWDQNIFEGAFYNIQVIKYLGKLAQWKMDRKY